MPKVLNVKDVGWPVPDGAVYVGRGGWRGRKRIHRSKWGNQFKIGRDGSLDEVISKYRAWIVQQPDRMNELPELCGKDLACHCAPQACHADVPLELANNSAAPNR
jgi:hypothetical protein